MAIVATWKEALDYIRNLLLFFFSLPSSVLSTFKSNFSRRCLNSLHTVSNYLWRTLIVLLKFFCLQVSFLLMFLGKFEAFLDGTQNVL